MAEFKIDSRIKVKTLKELFFNEFGGVLRVYNGNKMADDDATLASIRANDIAQGGELTCRANRTVGGFEKEMWDMFGIKVQIATKDDWVLVLDGITLSKIKDIPEKATKASMEDFLAYKRQKNNKEEVVSEEVEMDEDIEEEEDDDDGFCDNVAYNGIEYSADEESGAQANFFGDEDLEEASSIIIPEKIVDAENNKQYIVTGFAITDGSYSELTLPKTIKTIDGMAFTELESDINTLKLNLSGNTNLEIIDGIIMSKNYRTFCSSVGYSIQNVQLNKPSGKYIIPNNVVCIEPSAFANCDNLLELVLPSSLVEIGFDAFCDCSSLKKIIFYNDESAIKCYDDLGDEVKLSQIAPKGVEIQFLGKETIMQKEKPQKEEIIKPINIKENVTSLLNQNTKRKFALSSTDKKLAGVCGGIAAYLGINSLWIRLLAVLTYGFFFWGYIILWFIMPRDNKK